MADQRFFTAKGPFGLDQLASIAGAKIERATNPKATYEDVRPLSAAGVRHVSFLDNRRYLGAFKESRAGACLVHVEHAALAPEGMTLLVCEDPYRAYAQVAAAFYPDPPVVAGVSDRAIVDPSARVAKGVRIEAGALVAAGAEIGEDTIVGPNSVVAEGVSLGRDCRIGASCVLQKCVIGDRVVLHPGVSIGQDGFGFAPGAAGHLRVPQIGIVRIESDVDIGANTTIDRGAGPDTVIGQGTKIDNLVQIGHNVTIGRGCLIAAQVGVSGSTKIGDFVMIGGQAGFAGHIEVGNGVRIAGQSGVTHDIEPGLTIAGMPAMPARDHWRQLAVLGRLAKEGGARKRD